MVPTLVEKVVLPRVHSVVSRCWDPYSTTQTARLRELVTELLVYLDANLPQFKVIAMGVFIVSFPLATSYGNNYHTTRSCRQSTKSSIAGTEY